MDPFPFKATWPSRGAGEGVVGVGTIAACLRVRTLDISSYHSRDGGICCVSSRESLDW
jgi:hypothetical protein